MASSCPESDDVAAFLEGSLDASARDAIEAHLDVCAACRALVAALGTAFVAPADAFTPDAPDDAATFPASGKSALVAGTRVGRYVVERQIGRGGMGVVYSARDPELERVVAIKLMAPLGGASRREVESVTREARAAARVAHPNVVGVFDAGVFEGFPFVAFELIDGPTLRVAIERGDRFEALASILEDAARGLEAIHRSGIVHRDFKPENVLVGSDGRARVGDFGLSRALLVAAHPDDAGAGRDVTAVQASMLAGTLPYMAPEQHRNEAIDERADQYAFGVVLFEVAFGRRPFAGASNAVLLREKERGPSIPGTLPRAQRHLGAVIARALSADPAARYPSMQRLAVEAFPRSAGSRGLAWAAPLAVAAVIGAASWMGAAEAPRCDDASRAEASFLSEGRRAAIVASLGRSPTPGAVDAAGRVGTRLDAYASGWSAARLDACALAGDDAAAAYLRSSCLDRGLAEVDALASVIERGTVTDPSKVLEALDEIAPPSRCAEDARLRKRETPIAPPELRERVDAFEARLRHAEALLRAGQFEAAATMLDADRVAVFAVAFDPLSAEWSFLRARAAQENVAGAETEKLFRQAIDLAEVSRHDVVAAEAWLGYTRFLAWQGTAIDRADLAADRTLAAVKRLGGDPEKEDLLAGTRAFLVMAVGDLAGAYAALQALDDAQRDRGATPRSRRDTLLETWRAAFLLGRYDEAYDAADRGLAEARASLFDAHPKVGDFLHARGAAALHLGDLTGAENDLAQALGILDDVHGADHTRLEFVLNDLARLHSARGNDVEAVLFAESAVYVNRHFPPMHPAPSFARLGLGEVLLRVGRLAEAEKVLRAADGFFSRAMPPGHFLGDESASFLALCQAELGRPEAVATLGRLARFEGERPPERAARVALASAVVARRGGAGASDAGVARACVEARGALARGGAWPARDLQAAQRLCE